MPDSHEERRGFPGTDTEARRLEKIWLFQDLQVVPQGCCMDGGTMGGDEADTRLDCS